MTPQTLTRPVRRGAIGFRAFKSRIERAFFRHPVIVRNAYTKWFREGSASAEQVRGLLLQFSVFSNHFVAIQAKRLVNAATEEGERTARFILVSECGVSMDPETGSTEGRTFATRNAHLNWLRETGAAAGLDPRRMGRWENGNPSTRGFLEDLERTYGSRDANIGAGASFAIENWAAFGIGLGEAEQDNFWKELINGLEAFNARRVRDGLEALPLGFFHYHFQLETGHGANVWRELEASFGTPGFDPEKFLQGGREALDAIHLFWLGLDRSRLRAVEPTPKTF